MAMDSRAYAVLIKGEGTEGTDASPTVGTDDIFVMADSSGIDTAQAVAEVRGASPTGDIQSMYVQSRMGTANYRVPLYGMGLDTGVIQLSRWAEVVLGSFMDINIGSSDSTSAELTLNLANPTTTDDGDSASANAKTFTIHEYKGLDGSLSGGVKTFTKLLGARVQTCTLNFPVGELATLEFTAIGRPTPAASSTTDLSSWTGEVGSNSDFITSNALQTQLTPNGGSAIDTCMNALTVTIDLGSAHIMGDCQDASGVAGTALGSPTVTVSINPLLASGDIATWMADVNAQDFFDLTSSEIFPLTRSANTGYGVILECARLHANFTQIDTGNPELRLPLEATASLPSASGNFKITLN